MGALPSLRALYADSQRRLYDPLDVERSCLLPVHEAGCRVVAVCQGWPAFRQLGDLRASGLALIAGG